MTKIEKTLAEKILVLDGAMGTMLQAYKFEEEVDSWVTVSVFHEGHQPGFAVSACDVLEAILLEQVLVEESAQTWIKVLVLASNCAF